MRLRGLFTVWFILLVGCATSPSEPPTVVEPPEREVVLKAAAHELAAGRFGFGEEFLSAAGAEASPWVLPLLDNANPDVRLAAQALLLSAGEDLRLSPEEEVEVILFDLSREESHPFAGIRALDRWQRLGETARPALISAEGDGGRRGAVARRLLNRMAEKP